MTIKNAAFVFGLLSLVIAPPSFAIPNGFEIGNEDFPSVVKLGISVSAGDSICTATVLSSNTLLTAAHCFLPSFAELTKAMPLLQIEGEQSDVMSYLPGEISVQGVLLTQRIKTISVPRAYAHVINQRIEALRQIDDPADTEIGPEESEVRRFVIFFEKLKTIYKKFIQNSIDSELQEKQNQKTLHPHDLAVVVFSGKPFADIMPTVLSVKTPLKNTAVAAVGYGMNETKKYVRAYDENRANIAQAYRRMHGHVQSLQNIITLNPESLDQTYANFITLNNLFNQSLRIHEITYALRLEELSRSAGIKRWGTNVVYGSSNGMIQILGHGTNLSPPNGKRVGISKGDSGGPLFIVSSRKVVQVGVASFFDDVVLSATQLFGNYADVASESNQKFFNEVKAKWLLSF